MARYKITSLNYITAGKQQAFINVDAALAYEQPTVLKILDTEQSKLSVISLDQGNIEYIDTEHIKKETQEPLSLEQLDQQIVLREDQKWIKNVEAQDKSAILLKTSDDVKSKLDELSAYQSQMSAINNLTFELEVDVNDFKNNLQQTETNRKMFPMYDIRNLSVKSANKKKMVNKLYNTDKYVDLYAPSMLSGGPIKFCEANGYSYMLLEQTRDTPQSLNAYFNDNEDNSYYMQIASRHMKTYAYPSLDILNDEAIRNGQIDSPCGSYAELFEKLGYDENTIMQMLFQIKRNFNNLKYNYILDFDQNALHLDYDAGDIYTKNINIGKNIYNSMYTIDIPNAYNINSTREYFGIGSMNNRVFLTYIDDVNLNAISSRKADEGNVVEVKTKTSSATKKYYINDETGEIVQ